MQLRVTSIYGCALRSSFQPRLVRVGSCCTASMTRNDSRAMLIPRSNDRVAFGVEEHRAHIVGHSGLPQ